MSDETSATPDADEFSALPTATRPKSPLLAVAVVALAAIVCWHLRRDVAYAFVAKTAVDLGDARTLTARGVTLDDNRYVTVAGQAERRYALYLEPHGTEARQSFFRLFGTGTRLFVRANDNMGRQDVTERWTGRLRRFDELPFAQSLRDYYGKETEVTRYLALDSVKAALSGGSNELVDRVGASLTLPLEAQLVVDVAHPGQLQVWLSKDKYPTLIDARHDLERLQLSPSTGTDEKDEFSFIVPMPDAKKNEIIGKLSDAGFQFQPYRQRLTSARGQLKLDGDTLAVGADAHVPWADVEAIGLPAPITIGADAFVLSEGDSPAAYWWAPLLCALLVAFAAFNLWYLLRALRAPA